LTGTVVDLNQSPTHHRASSCGHGIERIVYRVDDDGRWHYTTLPLR
jgi:hypothetical protein